MSVQRMHEQKQTAQLAEQFNQFYLQITLPHVSQIGNYKIIEEIGEGAFGKVYLAQHLILNTSVVLKCGLLDDPNIVREIYYHRQLRHKNIVKLYEVIKTETHLWMALEYCEGLELFYYIYEKRRLGLEVCRHLFYQIVEGIKYVHSLNLSHRDLKLENILLADKKKTVIKLTDFGFVREFNANKRQFLSTVCGTTAYMAPEVLQNLKYSGFAVDVWSLGVILYAMLYGELPFDEDDDLKNKYKIINEEPEYKDSVAPETIHLMKRMLSKDPWARPSLTEIFNSPFLIDITNKKLENRNSIYNDAESVLSISQHYKMNAMPFQSKTERHLLKKLEKLNVDLDALQSSVFAGQTNSLTAFYELALTQEFRKKKSRYLKKKRYFEAKRQLKKSRNRVKSALSLDQTSTGAPPLERIISSLSISSRQDQSGSRVNLSRKSTEDHRKTASSRGSAQPLSSMTRIGSDPTQRINNEDVPVPQKRSVSFFPDDRRTVSSVTASEQPKGKSKKFLDRIQFWRKSKSGEEEATYDDNDYYRASNSFEEEDDKGLEINPKPRSKSTSAEKLVVESQMDANDLCEVPATDHPNFLQNGHRRDVSDNTIPSTSSMEVPQMQISTSHDSYYRRTRPESVVSQVSQFSQLSQLYPMSESELDGTDMEDEYLDDDIVYDSSINTSQHELPHLKPTTFSLTSSGGKKKRPSASRALSDGLLISVSTSSKNKKYSLSQVSSNSSDESSVRSKLMDRFLEDSIPSRPISPRTKIARKTHPKLRPLRSGSSTKSSSSLNQVQTPLPVAPSYPPMNGTMPRSHSPPINSIGKLNVKSPPSSMAYILNTNKKSDSNGYANANGQSNGRAGNGVFDTVQVDNRIRKLDSNTATNAPRRFDFINEEEEEDDDEV